MKRKKSLLLSLIFSYIALFILALLMGSAILLKAQEDTKERVMNYNSLLIEDIRDRMDSLVQEIDLISYHITSDETFMKLIETNQINENSLTDLYPILSLIKNYSASMHSNQYICDAFIYFDEPQLILNKSLEPAKSFFENACNYQNYSYESWVNTYLKGLHYKQYFPAALITNRPMQKKVITYAQSLPVNSVSDPKATLIIQIDADKFLEMIQSIGVVNEGNVYILDKNKQIMLANKIDERDIATIPYVSFDNQKYLESKDTDKFIMYTTSAKNRWFYAACVPKSALLREIRTLKLWMFFIISLYILIGIFMIIKFTRNTYRPIQFVMNKLNGRNVKGNYKNFSDINSIINRIDYMSAHEKELYEHLTEQKSLLQNDFLCKLLKGQLSHLDNPIETLRSMNIKFHSDFFCTVIINIENCDQFIKQDSQKEWQLVYYAISNIMEELLSQKFSTFYLCNVDQTKVAALLNLSPEERLDTDCLPEICENFSSILYQHLQINSSIGISCVQTGYSNIDTCYREALTCLDYRSMGNTNAVIPYNSLKKSPQTGNSCYYYPIEIENRILNSVRLADANQINELIDEIIHTNLAAFTLTQHLKHCLYYDLLGTYMKAANLLNIDFSLLNKQKTPEQLHFLESGDLIDAVHDIQEKFAELCSLATEPVDTPNSLTSQIKQYVYENYADYGLSVTMVADHFGITRQYLSKIFRQDTGIKLIDFIAKVRIEESKKLLSSSDFTILQIATMVGYADDSSFIRLFKKYEGITPGKYKDSSHS